MLCSTRSFEPLRRYVDRLPFLPIHPRHEYFRRTLCNLVGRDVENGEIPASEMDRVNQMIEDISYNNAKNFFKF